MDDERYNDFFHVGVRNFPHSFWITPEEHLLNPFSCALTDDSTVLAFIDQAGEMLGTVAVQRVLNRTRRAHVGWIYRMFVDPQHWGKGVGKELLGAAIRTAREMKITSLLLSVSSENERARTLYVAQGFECMGIEKNSVCVDGQYRDEEMFQLILD